MARAAPDAPARPHPADDHHEARAGRRHRRSARARRRRAPRMVFDYVDGAAESERSLRASVEAFDRVTFRPRVLRDVGTVSTSTDVLGRRLILS
ncbi:alpha-hydroxy-acid oxidizing protein [Modestobacter sp. VKM Ac-2977]|uniref:alpha-hydroxy-acid oxidizing protein n=1 Tax=Modestobacter sp. VKM Ac-2977 TaxID=3004131 RepID=UPI003FA53AD0